MSGFLARDAYINAKSGHTSPFTRDIWVVFRVFSGDGTAAKGTAETLPFPSRLTHPIECHWTKIAVRPRCSGQRIWRCRPDHHNNHLFWFSRLVSSLPISGICRNPSYPFSCQTCRIAPMIFAFQLAFWPSGMTLASPGQERQRR